MRRGAVVSSHTNKEIQNKVSDIIKWFRQDEQKIVLREEYQRQRVVIPDLRQVLHKDTTNSQLPERLHWVMPVKTLEQITGSDPQRFAEAMVASTSKTITGMVCDLVGSDGKQTGEMAWEDIARVVTKLIDGGIKGPFNCVLTPDNYSQLIQSFRQIDHDQISEDERDEIKQLMNQCGHAHGMRKGSWRGVGIYVAQRCAQSFVFAHEAIQYSERRDDELITNLLTAEPKRPPYFIDLGEMFLTLYRAPDALEIDVVAHCWPTVSIANKDAIVFIQTLANK